MKPESQAAIRDILRGVLGDLVQLQQGGIDTGDGPEYEYDTSDRLLFNRMAGDLEKVLALMAAKEEK